MTTPRTEAQWDAWQQEKDGKYKRSTPLKRELLAAQAKVNDMLNRVIRDGETITIRDDNGNPVAKIMPYTGEN